VYDPWVSEGLGCPGDPCCLPWAYDFASLLHDRVWFHGEYLMWWTRSANLPALATTSPPNTQQAQAGVLGQAGTTILFGGDAVNPGIQSGARFTLGTWLFPDQETGIEVTYLFLGNAAVKFNATDQNAPILAQPFFNTQTGKQDSSLVAFPGSQTGSLNIGLDTALNSTDLLLRRALVRERGYRMDYLLGYRYARLAEGLTVDASSTFTNPAGVIPVGTVLSATDSFAAANQFNGGELGIATRTQRGRLSLDLLAKVALGDTRSRVTINGETVTTAPQASPVVSPGGFLALPTNIGHYQQDRFSVIPELRATIEYQLTDRLKATFGYTFMYWSQVARPGDQVNLNLNPSQFPPGQLTGSPSPQFKFVATDFWAQGLSFGLDWRF